MFYWETIYTVNACALHKNESLVQKLLFSFIYLKRNRFLKTFTPISKSAEEFIPCFVIC